jgi:hypothetical protein
LRSEVRGGLGTDITDFSKLIMRERDVRSLCLMFPIASTIGLTVRGRLRPAVFPAYRVDARAGRKLSGVGSNLISSRYL